jgi:hypothetical protein
MFDVAWFWATQNGSALPVRLKVLDRWIAALAKGGVNALHDYVVDFAPLFKGSSTRSGH